MPKNGPIEAIITHNFQLFDRFHKRFVLKRLNNYKFRVQQRNNQLTSTLSG